MELKHVHEGDDATGAVDANGPEYQNFKVDGWNGWCRYKKREECHRRTIRRERLQIFNILPHQGHMGIVKPPASPGTDSGCDECHSQWAEADRQIRKQLAETERRQELRQ